MSFVNRVNWPYVVFKSLYLVAYFVFFVFGFPRLFLDLSRLFFVLSSPAQMVGFSLGFFFIFYAIGSAFDFVAIFTDNLGTPAIETAV